jgi:hypothetical protein
MLYHHTMVNTDIRSVMLHEMFSITFSWRHGIGMWEKKSLCKQKQSDFSKFIDFY